MHADRLCSPRSGFPAKHHEQNDTTGNVQERKKDKSATGHGEVMQARMPLNEFNSAAKNSMKDFSRSDLGRSVKAW
jgi:hypothetical protein